MARSTTGWWENDGGKQWLMMGNSGLSGGLNYILYIYIYIWLVVFRHPSEKSCSESQLG